jgi:hypothetical protein
MKALQSALKKAVKITITSGEHLSEQGRNTTKNQVVFGKVVCPDDGSFPRKGRLSWRR